MGMKLRFVAEHVVNRIVASPHDLAATVLAARHVKVELAHVIHFMVGIERARKNLVGGLFSCLSHLSF